MKHTLLLATALSCAATAIAQTTVTFKPDATAGQDAGLYRMDNNVIPTGYPATPATMNFGNAAEASILRWTFNGDPGTTRLLIRFTGLNSIPAGSQILSAQLNLFTPATTSNWGNSYFSGSPYPLANNGWVKRVQPGSAGASNNWNEQTVTWNNQPAVDPNSANWVSLPLTTSRWNYTASVNVTAMVQQIMNGLLSDPNANNGFLVMMADEINYYRSQIFATSDDPNCAYWPELIVRYNPRQSLTSSAPQEATAVLQMDRIAIGDGPEKALNLKVKTDPKLSISPNPASNGWNIRFVAEAASAVTVNVYDMAGKLIRTTQQELPKGICSIYQPATQLAPGVYFIEVLGAGVDSREKVVKQ